MIALTLLVSLASADDLSARVESVTASSEVATVQVGGRAYSFSAADGDDWADEIVTPAGHSAPEISDAVCAATAEVCLLTHW